MDYTQTITIPCDDEYNLTGSLYIPDRPVASVMIAPATGIKRGFYHAFANYLAENGYAVLTYDNRGIGDSITSELNDCNASLSNWGQLDMTACLNKLMDLFPECQYHIIGHSAGGQLIGLMKNASKLTSIFNVASSSGSMQYFKYPFKIKSYLFLNIFIPLSNAIFGYTKTQWIGMGEPLPKEVGAEWQKWCNNKGYVDVELGKTIHNHFYGDLSIPSLWVHATDDNIANIDTVRDMIRVYSKIDADILTLDPKEYGYNDIGHMKFFTAKRQNLWGHALDWFRSKTK